MGTVEPQVVTNNRCTSHVTDGFSPGHPMPSSSRHRHDLRSAGIPITDLTRMAQARDTGDFFRHEQNAGNAAAIAAHDQKPASPDVSAPASSTPDALANATTNCFPMILISGSSEREIVDLQQGDYEEMDQLAIAKAASPKPLPRAAREDIGVGIARALRAAVSGRPGGVYLDRLRSSLPRPSTREPAASRSSRSSTRAASMPARRPCSGPSGCSKSAKRPLIVRARARPMRRPTRTFAPHRAHGIPTCPCRWRRAAAGHSRSVPAAARSYVLPRRTS